MESIDKPEMALPSVPREERDRRKKRTRQGAEKVHGGEEGKEASVCLDSSDEMSMCARPTPNSMAGSRSVWTQRGRD
jgi:hypothetical protein